MTDDSKSYEDVPALDACGLDEDLTMTNNNETDNRAGYGAEQEDETMAATNLEVGQYGIDTRGAVWLREDAHLHNVLKGGRVGVADAERIGSVIPLGF